jgi:hypothetical protein
MLKSLARRELPDGLKNLRGLTFGYGGIQEFYIAFEMDDRGILRICESFRGEGVEEHRFPGAENDPLRWGLSNFERAHDFEEQLGISLFDVELVRKIVGDDLENLHTGEYPQSAVRGTYMKFGATSETETTHFHVLAFTDRKTVYVAAGRRPERAFSR